VIWRAGQKDGGQRQGRSRGRLRPWQTFSNKCTEFGHSRNAQTGGSQLALFEQVW